MTVGTVKFFNASKGFGFIAPQDGGKDVFVHISAVGSRKALRILNEGQKVEPRHPAGCARLKAAPIFRPPDRIRAATPSTHPSRDLKEAKQ